MMKFISNEEILERWLRGDQYGEIAADLRLTRTFVARCIDDELEGKARHLLDAVPSINSPEWDKAYKEYRALVDRYRLQYRAHHSANRRLRNEKRNA